MDLEFTEAVEAGRLMEILQPLLPQGIEILSVDEVPVRGKSLSQEISGAEWSFDLILESGGSTDWSEALAAITAAKELIWHDTDKKGRPRQRDCRPAIRRLDCLTDGQGERVRLRLEASVDPMGRSVRPSQIQHWIEKQLSEPLTLKRLSRDGLQLSEC